MQYFFRARFSSFRVSFCLPPIVLKHSVRVFNKCELQHPVFACYGRLGWSPVTEIILNHIQCYFNYIYVRLCYVSQVYAASD
jgi:hypothetical protein